MSEVATEAVDIMADVTITVDVSRARKRLFGYKLRTANQVRPLMQSRHLMEMANVANFAGGGLPSGGWAPLSPQYAAWKAIAFPGRPPLVRTGRLFSELASLRGQAFEVQTPTTAVFRLPNVEYAKFHQYGTTKMPKRRIVFEPAGFGKAVGVQVKHHILDETSPGHLLGLFR